MKNLKINIFTKILLLFVLSVSIVNCSDDSSDIGNNDNLNTNFIEKSDIKYTYNDVLKNAKSLKDLTVNAINNAKGKTFKDENSANTYFTNYVVENNSLEYFDVQYLNYNEFTEDFDFKDYGFSQVVSDYFNDVVYLYEKDDYEAMVQLLNKYKKDLKSNKELLALSGLFATIEVYKEEILGKTSQAKTVISFDCPPTAKQIAGGAIGGAISGAVTGATFGSFLGPAGTLLGGLGGAIYGSLFGSITSIGVGSLLNGNDC